jgi:NAD(P)-dependent dehydrogenase (short-subunit alcohol dehydrogenase family)
MNILVTGGHSGIGLELVRRLHADGATVGLIVRSPSRIDDLPAAIREAPGFTYWVADLGVHADVARVASEIAQRWDRIDVLYNNAGELRRSGQGHEMHYEVNTLAPMHLTRGLKPLLDAADAPIVVNTVTGGMHSAKALDLDQLTDPQVFRKLFGQYLQSKLALTLWMDELAGQDAWSGIAVRNVNPGANKTGMTESDGVPWFIRMVRGLLFSAPTKGGNLLYDAAFDPGLGRRSGVFLDEGKARQVPLRLDDTQRATLEAGLA